MESAQDRHPSATLMLGVWDAPLFVPPGVESPPHWIDHPAGALPPYVRRSDRL